jgi:hypothetical protein
MGVRAFQESRTLRGIAATLGILAAAGALLGLLVRVRAGHGLEPYLTVRGYETSAIQVLATAIGVVVAFALYRLVSAVRRRRRRSGYRWT